MTARYPLDPLIRHAGGIGVLANELHMSGSRLRALAANGLTADQADTLATRLGLHPGEAWPQWWDDGLTPADRIFIPLRAREGRS